MSRRPAKPEDDWVSVIISDSFDAYQAVHSLTGVCPHFDVRRNDSYVKALLLHYTRLESFKDCFICCNRDTNTNALNVVTLSLRAAAKQSHKNWIALSLRSSQ